MEDTDKQHNNSIDKKEWLAPFQYKKGQTGNANGRPKGKSLKEYTRERLASMTDEEREEFLNGIPKIDIYKMAEGNPKNEDTLKVDLVPYIATKEEEELAQQLLELKRNTRTNIESKGTDTEPLG